MSYEAFDGEAETFEDWDALATAVTGADVEARPAANDEAGLDYAGERDAVETGMLAMDGLRAVMGQTRLETGDQDKVSDWEDEMAEAGLTNLERRNIMIMSLPQPE